MKHYNWDKNKKFKKGDGCVTFSLSSYFPMLVKIINSYFIVTDFSIRKMHDELINNSIKELIKYEKRKWKQKKK